EALLVEAKVDFQTELSAQIARSTTGETITYPIVETIQTNGVADIVKAPAPRLDASTAEAARHAAETIANGVDVTGMLAVELFHAPDSAAGFMINELAMRPHNTGHWTQDGAITSQFEQHLRAVLGLPLGATDPIAPYTVMKNNLGAGNNDLYGAFPLAMQKYPAAKIHAYGKTVPPGRKMAHFNVLDTDGALDAALTTAIHAAQRPRVEVVMRSDSDWPVMQAASEALTEFGIEHEVQVVSAHRMPHEMLDYGSTAAQRGLSVIIAGAGGAAHLPGMLASTTPI